MPCFRLAFRPLGDGLLIPVALFPATFGMINRNVNIGDIGLGNLENAEISINRGNLFGLDMNLPARTRDCI